VVEDVWAVRQKIEGCWGFRDVQMLVWKVVALGQKMFVAIVKAGAVVESNSEPLEEAGLKAK